MVVRMGSYVALVALILGHCLTGCVTTQQGARAPDSNRPTSLQSAANDYEQTVIEGVAIGAVGGALLGGVITALTGGGAGDVARNAGIGAALGGLLGAGVGGSAAESKQRQIAAEDSLDAAIADAQASNRQLLAVVEQAELAVVQRNSELERLMEQNLAAEQEQGRKSTLLARLNEDKRALDSAIDLARKERDEINRSITNWEGDSKLGDLKAELSETEEHIDALEEAKRQLDALEGKL